jgi:hypothetical protein
MTPEARAEWHAMLAKGAASKARAAQLAAPGRPVRFAKAGPYGCLRALAGPDMAGDAPFRLTTICADGEPWGHNCFDSLADAIYQALTLGYEPLT